uniref:MIA SH3 domain containing n=2 Tax=Latimeria chalumnae TaxID=7897 RepID=H3BE57_LATCH
MAKLAGKKYCADEECSHPISIALALEDYIPPDCRFIDVRKGQTVFIYSKLKGQGRLFWYGTVQGGYYEEREAKLGYFPSSIVQETQVLKEPTEELPTTNWDFYCE